MQSTIKIDKISIVNQQIDLLKSDDKDGISIFLGIENYTQEHVEFAIKKLEEWILEWQNNK